MIKAHHGKVAMYARQLNSGREIAIDADEPVQTASVIKLAILYNAMVDVREGKASWDEKLTLKPGEAVGGSGLLPFPGYTGNGDAEGRADDDGHHERQHGDESGDRPVWRGRGECAGGVAGAEEHAPVQEGDEAGDRADAGRLPKFGLGKTTPREMAEMIEQIGECHLRRADVRERQG